MPLLLFIERSGGSGCRSLLEQRFCRMSNAKVVTTLALAISFAAYVDAQQHATTRQLAPAPALGTQTSTRPNYIDILKDRAVYEEVQRSR